MKDLSYLKPRIDEANAVIDEALKRFNNVGVGLSGGSDSVVLLNLVLPKKWDIPVIFVDTGYQFKETYDYIDMLERDWDLNLYRYKAELPKIDYYRNTYGEDTEDFYFNCCMYHKVSPMMQAIRDLKLDAFMVGIRGVEHPERAKETPIAYKPDMNPPHYRVHPLLYWNRQEIIDYMLLYTIPVNPLYNQGYTSLGCIWCTKPNKDPNTHERAGRARKRELIKHKLKEEGYN